MAIIFVWKESVRLVKYLAEKKYQSDIHIKFVALIVERYCLRSQKIQEAPSLYGARSAGKKRL